MSLGKKYRKDGSQGCTGVSQSWAVQGSQRDGESGTAGLVMAPISHTHGKLDTKHFAPPLQLSPPHTTGIFSAQLFQQPGSDSRMGRPGSTGMLFPWHVP